MTWPLTVSQKFLVFWLALIGGLIIGSLATLPVIILVWLSVIWLVLFVSGQKEPLETISLVIFSLLVGWLIWQWTGGEVWAHAGFLATMSGWLITLRDHIVDRIFTALPEPHGSLLTGILLGNRVKLDKELIQTFRAVGLSHIIAVSGYNLTILTVNVQTLFRPLLGRKAVFVSVAMILTFVIISGAPASILRAAVMAGSLLLAQLVGRPSRSINLLIFAAGILAIFEPKIIFDVGFQLSVAATYGLIRLTPLLELAFAKIPLPIVLKDVVSQTLAATILTAPLLIAHFERLSLISPLTNILVVPTIPFLMGLGLVAAAVLLLYPPVGNLVAQLCWPILTWILFISNRAANLRFAVTNVTLSGWIIGAVMLLIVIWLEYLAVKLKNREPNLLLKFSGQTLA